METDNNEQEMQQYSIKDQPVSNITLSIPNPRNIIIFFRKIVTKPLKTIIFLIIFLILDLSLLYISTDRIVKNKKLEEDNLTLYEMIEVNNIARAVLGRRVYYLENMLSDNGVYLDTLYYIDIVDETYTEYEDTIKEFKKVNLNKIVDEYLNLDYSKKLYENRVKESGKESYSNYKNNN